MKFKKFLISLIFIFLALFGVFNIETSNYEIKTVATISSPKTMENDIVEQKISTIALVQQLKETRI